MNHLYTHLWMLTSCRAIVYLSKIRSQHPYSLPSYTIHFIHVLPLFHRDPSPVPSSSPGHCAVFSCHAFVLPDLWRFLSLVFHDLDTSEEDGSNVYRTSLNSFLSYCFTIRLGWEAWGRAPRGEAGSPHCTGGVWQPHRLPLVTLALTTGSWWRLPGVPATKFLFLSFHMWEV